MSPPPPPPMGGTSHNELKYRPSSEALYSDRLLSPGRQVDEDLVDEESPRTESTARASNGEPDSVANSHKGEARAKDLNDSEKVKWNLANASTLSLALDKDTDFDTSTLSRRDKLRRAYYGAWLSIIERSKPKAGLQLLIRVQVLPVLWLILDFFQVTTMFAPRTASTSTDPAYRYIMEVITLNWESADFVSFVVALCSVILAFIGILYMTLGFLIGRQPNQIIANQFGTYLSLLVAFVYVPILRSLFSIFVCFGGSWYDQFSCYGVEHIFLMFLSFIASAFFFGFICMVSQNAFEIDPHATHILRRWHGRLDLLYILIKTLLVLLRTFLWGSRNNIIASRTVILLTFFGSTYYLYRNRPYYMAATNNFRVALFSTMSFCAFCGWVDHVLDDTARTMAIIYWSCFMLVLMGAYYQAHRTTGPPAWLLPVDPTTRFHRYVLPWLSKLEIGSSPDIILNLGLAFLVKSSTRYGRLAYHLDTERHNYREAKYYYLKALAADDHHATNLGRYADYLSRVEGEHDEAGKMFELALQLQPNHLVNLATYGNFLVAIMKKPREADEFYQRSVSLDPNHSNYLALYSASSDGLLIMNQDGLCLDCNGALLRLFEGSTREEFSKYRLFQLTSYEKGTKKVDSAQEDMGNLYLEAAMKTGRTRFEWRFRKITDDDAEFIADVLLTPVTHHGVSLIQASITDVTQRKKVEAEMEDRDDHMRKIQETMADGIITIDTEGMIKYFNPAAEKIFGYDMYEVVGHNINMLMEEKMRDFHDEAIADCVREEREVISEGREMMGLKKTGDPVQINVRLTGTLVGDQRLFTAVFTVVDVAKEESEEFFNKTTTPVFVINKNGLITRSNKSWRRLFGYKSIHNKALDSKDLIDTSQVSAWETHVANAVLHAWVLKETSFDDTISVKALRKDGTSFTAEFTLVPIKAGANKQSFIVTVSAPANPVAVDEDPFVDNVAKALGHLNGSEHPSLMVSDDGAILVSNESLAQKLGFTNQDLLGRPLSDLVSPVHFHPDFAGEDGDGTSDLSKSPVRHRRDTVLLSESVPRSARTRAATTIGGEVAPAKYSSMRNPRALKGNKDSASASATVGYTTQTVPVRRQDGTTMKLVVGSKRVIVGDTAFYIGSFRELEAIRKLKRLLSDTGDSSDEDDDDDDDDDEEDNLEDQFNDMMEDEIDPGLVSGDDDDGNTITPSNGSLLLGGGRMDRSSVNLLGASPSCLRLTQASIGTVGLLNNSSIPNLVGSLPGSRPQTPPEANGPTHPDMSAVHAKLNDLLGGPDPVARSASTVLPEREPRMVGRDPSVPVLKLSQTYSRLAGNRNGSSVVHQAQRPQSSDHTRSPAQVAKQDSGAAESPAVQQGTISRNGSQSSVKRESSRARPAPRANPGPIRRAASVIPQQARKRHLSGNRSKSMVVGGHDDNDDDLDLLARPTSNSRPSSRKSRPTSRRSRGGSEVPTGGGRTPAETIDPALLDDSLSTSSDTYSDSTLSDEHQGEAEASLDSMTSQDVSEGSDHDITLVPGPDGADVADEGTKPQPSEPAAAVAAPATASPQPKPEAKTPVVFDAAAELRNHIKLGPTNIKGLPSMQGDAAIDSLSQMFTAPKTGAGEDLEAL